MNNYSLDNKNKQMKLESIAEQWVNLVLAQILAKKSPHKELIKIKTKDE